MRAARIPGAYAGVSDPERKRKIIWRTFIDIFERKAKRSAGAKFLAQRVRFTRTL